MVYTWKYLLWRHAVWTERSEVRAAWRHNKYFPYGPNSRLMRALLYTHTSKTTKSQCFPLLLWTEVQPVHMPVRTQVYGLALSQSNFSILSVFCLVYNKMISPLVFSHILHKLFSSVNIFPTLQPFSIIRNFKQLKGCSNEDATVMSKISIQIRSMANEALF